MWGHHHVLLIVQIIKVVFSFELDLNALNVFSSELDLNALKIVFLFQFILTNCHSLCLVSTCVLKNFLKSAEIEGEGMKSKAQEEDGLSYLYYLFAYFGV